VCAGVSVVGTPTADPVKAITVGDTHACALDVDSTVVCWGDDTSGQSTPPPPPVVGVPAPTGAFNARALLSRGSAPSTFRCGVSPCRVSVSVTVTVGGRRVAALSARSSRAEDRIVPKLSKAQRKAARDGRAKVRVRVTFVRPSGTVTVTL
jgi:hypothetical protein